MVDVSHSTHIEKKLSFSRVHLRMSLCQIFYLRTFLKHVNYTGVLKLLETDVLLHFHLNFGVLFNDSIVSTFLFYHFYLKIYVRLSFNLMRKKILIILRENCRDHNDLIYVEKNYLVIFNYTC